MARNVRITLAVAVVVAAACNPAKSPVPVQGAVTQLVGEWAGEYSSMQTGRHGSIQFLLKAGADTATGDVLMLADEANPNPTAPRSPDEPWWRASSQVLQISFVRCEGGEVSGWMTPYPDPGTGETTYTTFTGLITNGELKGTYASWVEKTGRRTTGNWSAKRVKSAP